MRTYFVSHYRLEIDGGSFKHRCLAQFEVVARSKQQATNKIRALVHPVADIEYLTTSPTAPTSGLIQVAA